MTKIVIIDDFVSNALLIKAYLKGLAVETVICSSPIEALAWCKDNDPALVLLDFMMPGMTGTEFLVRFRANPRLQDVPVVMVTWDERKETFLQTVKAGATDFLQKPLDRAELITRVQALVELSWGRKGSIEADPRTTQLSTELSERIANLEASYDMTGRREPLVSAA